jgi:hypothetical protein
MATNDSTAPAFNSTPAQNAAQFPESGEPFAIWYSLPPHDEVGMWAINDDHGDGIFEAYSYVDAVKLSRALIASFQPHESEESRAGALACLEALRIVEHLTSAQHPEMTNEEYWRSRESAAAAMVFAAGKPSPFLSGFVSAFAEHYYLHHTGKPNLYVWKPEAAMTEYEKAAHRATYDDEEEIQHV